MKKLLSVLIIITLLLSINIATYADEYYDVKCVYDASANTLQWDNMQTAIFQGNTASQFEYLNNSITTVIFPGPVQVQLTGIFDGAYLYRIGTDENNFNPDENLFTNVDHTPKDQTNTVMLTEGEYTLSFMLNYGTYSTGAGVHIKIGNGSYNTPSVPHAPTNNAPLTIDTNRSSYFTSMTSLSANANISNWASAEVNIALAKSIVPLNIYNEGNYKRPVTRKEFAYIMVGAMQSLNYTFDELVSDFVKYGFGTQFTDTNNDPIIEIARRNLIVSGTSDTAFSPDSLLTREQGAAMLERLYIQCQTKYGVGKPIINSPTYFADRDNFSSWAVNSINFVSAITDPTIKSYVMGGVGNDMFQPKGNITVEQALAATKRLMAYAKGEHDRIQDYINSQSKQK